MRIRLHATLGFVLFVLSGTANAQLTSDTVPRERTIPRREQMDEDLEDARLHLGPFRIAPVFGLRDVGYNNNVFGTAENPVDDWGATVRAGVDVILPVGRKTYLMATAVPEYTWYSELVNRRSFGGTYGGSWLGLFNRLSIEAGAMTTRGRRPVSSEIELSAESTREDAFARAEIDIFRRLSVFGSARGQRHAFETGEETISFPLARLERDERLVSAGVRYKWRSYLDFTLAAEQGSTEFESATDRDNESRAALLGVHYSRPRSFVNLTVGRRQWEPQAGSTVPEFSATTGSYYLEYQLAAPPQIDVYGHRLVTYSASADAPFFFETRNGLGLTVPVGERFGIRVHGEVGRNDYSIENDAPTARVDDVTAWGGGIAVRLYRQVHMSIVATQIEYDSNLDFDRSILRVTTFISLRGQAFR